MMLSIRCLCACALAMFVFSGCHQATKPTSEQPADSLSALSVPSLPEWTDRYADGKKGDVRFFNLTRLMNTHELSRLQAVELQNQYRDLTRKDASMTGAKGFEIALAAVRANSLESGLDAKALKQAKFIVVFDLDDTLFDQYYAGGETCHTHAYQKSDGQMKYVHMAPGWKKVIKKIHALGGKTAIFSANLDDRTITLLSYVKIDDVALTHSPLIAGILTNSHLIQQQKTEPPGSAEKPRKGRPVIEPSKDLRFFDESLSRVVIVDDNPLRLFQFRNTRVFKKFHADEYCKTQDSVYKKAIEGGMGVVESEIEWAVAYMTEHADVGFAQAYLPFTTLGQITMTWLMDTHDWTAEQAKAYIVAHPTVVDKRF
jgi:hypothetical protein